MEVHHEGSFRRRFVKNLREKGGRTRQKRHHTCDVLISCGG